MTSQQPTEFGLRELLKPLVLVVLTSISGIVVWSYHHFEWPGFLVYLIVGFVVGSLAGALVRVPLNSTWSFMATTGGVFAGVYQGWQYSGLIGAVIGGLVGFIGGITVAMLLMMFMSLVLVCCGIDPIVNAEADERGKTDAA